MTDIDRLVAIEAIKALKARYCYALDNKDIAAYSAVFAADAVFDISAFDVNGTAEGGSQPGPVLQGAREIAASVLGSLQDIQSSHRAFLPQIELQSASRAKATWSMEDWLRPPGGRIALAGFGYYYDDYVKQDGAWLILRSELVRWT